MLRGKRIGVDILTKDMRGRSHTTFNRTGLVRVGYQWQRLFLSNSKQSQARPTPRQAASANSPL